MTQAIQNVSDTAFMVAGFRASETERADALFRDPLAAKLAGDHGCTILTALLSLGAIGSLLVAGGPVIRPFALAMFIGTIVGTYSTIYIASPMVLWIETWRSSRAARAPVRPAAKPAKAKR